MSSFINLGRNAGTSLGSYFGGALITWLGTAAILPYFDAIAATITLILFGVQYVLLKMFTKANKPMEFKVSQKSPTDN